MAARKTMEFDQLGINRDPYSGRVRRKQTPRNRARTITVVIASRVFWKAGVREAVKDDCMIAMPVGR